MPCSEKDITGIFWALVICLVFFLGFLVWQPMAVAQDRPAPVKEITVAVGQDASPLYFRDAKGVADGWSVDLWRLWSQKSGIKVKFVLAPFGETLKLTKEGKVDAQGGCFFSGVRAKYLDYVAPLFDVDTHFFFHKDIYGIKTLKDLLGFRIGVIKGDFAVDYLRTNLPGAALAEYVNNGDLFEAVNKGEIRAFVIDTPVGLYFLNKMRLLSSFRYFSDKPLYSNVLQVAVKKGDTILSPVIKSGFEKITPEEKVQIERRWVGSKLIKTKGVLTIACDRYFPPFTMLTSSGKAAGIMVDLWRLWSSKNLRAIEFVFGDWKESVQMVKDGRADFHSGLYKTPERETFLSFSVPVFDVQDNLAFKTSQKPMTLAELSGARVGVIAGSGEETELREQYPKIIRIPYKGYPELLTGLQDGDVIAIYDVGVTLQQAIEDLGLQGEIRVARETTPARNLFAGVSKKDALRLKSINSGFAEITEKEIREIEARWVSNPDLRQYSGRARPMMLTSEEKEWLKKHPHIRLGVDPSFMPFEAFSSGGAYEGISSNYMAIMSKKLNVDMTPVKGLSWQEIIDAVKVGDLDVLPCVAKSPVRTEFLQFTRPYLDFQVVAVTRKDAPFIADIKGLENAKVAVVEGYFGHDMLKKDFPEMKLVLVSNIEEGLDAVSEGKAAAYVDNSATIIYNIREMGLADLKVAATTPYNATLRFGVRKDWPQLATILDKALNSVPQEERRNIANSWINVRFAQRTDWVFLIKMGIAVGLVIALILTIIIIWNRRMAREMVQRKRAEERFEAIAANTPGAIIQLRFSDEGIPEYLYLSAKAEAFFGMPPEQVIGEKERLRWHPEDRRRMLEMVPRLTAAGEDLNLVGRIQPKGDSVLWIRLNASPSRNVKGALIYSGFILDITQRKQTELEYLKSERKIKAMSQAAEDAMVMLDGEGKVLFWNPAAERLFGFSEAGAMGMDFHQMAAPQVYHDKIYKGLKHFAKTGEGGVLGTTTEITARNRKGHEFPVEVTISSFQVDDEWFAVGTVRDITERKQSEEALKKSERRLKTILETANDGFFAVDNNQKIIEANPAMSKILGREREDITGKTTFDFVDEENRKILLKQIEMRTGGEKGSYEIALSRSDGSHVSCLFNVSVYLDENNEKIGAFAMVTDITERKLAEEAIKNSERRLKTILETADEGFQLINTNLEVIDLNPKMCTIMGREKDDVIGKTIFDFVDEENKKIFLEQIELRKQGISSAYEIALSRPDGSNVNCLFNVTPLFDENNERIGAFAMVTDITERKQAEEAMKESEARTRLILNSAGEGIFGVNAEGHVVFINPGAVNMLGFEEKELLGKKIHALIHHTRADGTDYPVETCPMYAAYHVGTEHFIGDEVLWRKDGTSFPVEYAAKPILQNGQLRGAVVSFRDITERLKSEEELNERLEELEQFSRLVVGRETKMIGLKEEVNSLLKQLSQEEKYEIVQ